MLKYEEKQALWQAIESAGPEDSLPLLVAADWYADNPDENWTGAKSTDMEFCLRWCAGRKRRPFCRTNIVRKPWQWNDDKTNRRIKISPQFAASMVPWPLIPVIPSCLDGHPSCKDAYFNLAAGLKKLREAVSYPDAPVSPIRQLRPAGGLVTCGDCGIARESLKKVCPVCRSSTLKI